MGRREQAPPRRRFRRRLGTTGAGSGTAVDIARCVWAARRYLISRGPYCYVRIVLAHRVIRGLSHEVRVRRHSGTIGGP